jgi:hypothetical protein
MAATGAIALASIGAGHGQAPGDTSPQYIQVAVLELENSTDTSGWRLFALKTSATTMTVVVFRDDDEPVPAMQLVLNATPPVPVERVHAAHFEIWAPELTNVLSKNTLHALYISVGGREHTMRLTEAQRLALLAQSLRAPADSFAEDTVQDCRLTPNPPGDWAAAVLTNLIRRFNIVSVRGVTAPGRIALRARFARTGVPASLALVPSRTAAVNIMALRAVAGARVPPPTAENDGTIDVCLEMNPDVAATPGRDGRQD